VAAPSRLVAGLALTVALLAGGAGPAHASHRDRCRYEDCGDRYGDGYSQDYDGQWSNEDRNRNRNRNRGAFSPGPFDRSPVDVHDNCVSLDCSGSGDGQKKQPAPTAPQPKQSVGCLVPVPWHCDQRPAQLFPPTPSGLRDFVVNTVKAGIEMGRLFADTTITFVSNLLVGMA
jgi:hypothetical protein